MYRSFNKTNVKNFISILKNKLENLLNHSHSEFEKVFLNELNRHSPRKKKILRHNNNAFMTKELWKEIILTLKLKNKLNKEKN